MGEIARDIVEGACCQKCNHYFTEKHGYPVVCRDCYPRLKLSRFEKQFVGKQIYPFIGEEQKGKK